jgi:hypothetical protein
LSQAGRDELLAQASGDVLMVHRWRGNERRVLVMNFGTEPTSLESVAARIRLRQSRALLRSSEETEHRLAPHGAILLAGEGNLAGLVEGAA